MGKWRSLLACLAVVSLVATLIGGAVGAQPAVAAPVASQFNPGNIISDANFYNGSAMTEAEIQKFLVSKGSGLASYKSTMRDVPAQGTRCTAFTGGDNLLASTLIYRTQVACGISAKVLLVTLQKEQSLITTAKPSADALKRAMGYACPDTAPCDAYYFGFGNQVYWAALQFQTYKANPNYFNFRPGTYNILHHPAGAVACKTRKVTITNYATAGLYNYTPYTPNAEALAATPGPSSNPCASYGNRNFWYFYYIWFGSPTDITPTGVTVNRLEGSNRVETSVSVSKASYPSSAPIVYVANGYDFPDALTAAPAAAAGGGPLLLTDANVLSPSIKSEIQRLAPAEIVVVGGPGVVSDRVFSELSKLAPSIRRDAGINRYETSRNVAAGSFGDAGATAAFIVTGYNFPDALAAASAAGSLGAPIILVRGDAPSIDQQTIDTLSGLGVKTVYLAGGTAVLSTGIEASLRTVPGVTTVTRFGATSRYSVSGEINRALFADSDTVYFASGHDFPDALAGAAAAGAQNAPLYLTQPNCIYTHMLQDVVDFGASTVTLLGGTGVLGNGVAKFTNCH